MTVSASGETISSWKRRTGAIRAASPSTYTAIGMPRFPALTYPAHRAPIVVGPVPQWRSAPTAM